MFRRSRSACVGANALLLVIHRSNAAVDDRRRRRLAEVVADGAEHDRDLLRTIEIVDARAAPDRRPEACGPRRRPRDAIRVPAGSRPAPAAPETGRGRRPDPSRAIRPIDGRGASSSFSISPQIRSAGRSSSVIDRHRSRVCGVEREIEPRRKLDGAQHTQAVVAERGRIDHAEQTAGDVAAAVARIEILTGQRIPGDRVDREVAPPHRFVKRHRPGRPRCRSRDVRGPTSIRDEAATRRCRQTCRPGSFRRRFRRGRTPREVART